MTGTPREAVESWLHDQGFALEHAAAYAFRNAGFRASQGRTYRDDDSQKLREIDVLATPLFQAIANNLEGHQPLGVHCVVECKRGRNPWVALTSDDADLRRSTWTPVHYSADSLLRLAPRVLRDSLPRAHPTAYSVVEIHAKAGDSNPAYTACNQAISSALGAAIAAGPPVQIVYPIVVIDVPLFTATYGADGQEAIAEVPLARVLWSGSGVESPTQLDVVTRGALAEYARTLKEELRDVFFELERVHIEQAALRAEKQRRHSQQ